MPALIRVPFLLLILGLGLPAAATTIQHFSFEELAEQAEFIFQGEAIDVRVEESDGLLYTWVRFRVDEVVKGYDQGEQLELRFLGGETLDASVRVADMEIPAEGEEGIYFVESLAGGLVNPLLGWSQGQYLIERDGAGGERVRAKQGGENVLPDKNSALQEKLGGMKFGRSALESKLPAVPADLSPAEFKEAIRSQLEISR